MDTDQIGLGKKMFSLLKLLLSCGFNIPVNSISVILRCCLGSFRTFTLPETNDT